MGNKHIGSSFENFRQEERAEEDAIAHIDPDALQALIDNAVQEVRKGWKRDNPR